MAEICVACKGQLDWFASVHAWRHTWVPDGTTPHVAVRERDDYVADVVEAEVPAAVERIVASREEIEARGRAMREALGVIGPAPARELVVIQPAGDVLDPGRLVEHPKPVVPARPVLYERELCNAAVTFGQAALEYGWDVEALYARGWRPDIHRRRSHTRLVDLVVIRGRRSSTRELFAACWEDGKYDVGHYVVPGESKMLGAKELAATVKTEVMICADCETPAYAHPLEVCS